MSEPLDGDIEQFVGKHILTARQFTGGGLELLFNLARRMPTRARGELGCNVMNGHILGNFFFEESTRTRISSATAFIRLGGSVVGFDDPQFSSIIKGESVEDTAAVVSRFCDLMVVRCKQEGQAATIAEHSTVPVTNGGDGSKEHPTQALQDAYTITNHGQFGNRREDSTITFCGDLKNSRTAHSLVPMLLTCCSGKVSFVFVAPPESQMPQDILAEIKAKRGFEYECTEDFEAGLKAADALYMIRPQTNRLAAAELDTISGGPVLTRQLYETHCSKKRPIIIHPLPRNAEICRSVDGLPEAVYLKQHIDNGICIRMALFILVLGRLNKFD